MLLSTEPVELCWPGPAVYHHLTIVICLCSSCMPPLVFVLFRLAPPPFNPTPSLRSPSLSSPFKHPFFLSLSLSLLDEQCKKAPSKDPRVHFLLLDSWQHSDQDGREGGGLCRKQHKAKEPVWYLLFVFFFLSSTFFSSLINISLLYTNPVSVPIIPTTTVFSLSSYTPLSITEAHIHLETR